VSAAAATTAANRMRARIAHTSL